MAVLISKLLIFILPVVLGFSDEVIKSSIDYFKRDNIKLVCSLSCGDKTRFWNYKLTRNAINNSITVLSVDLDDVINSNDKIEKCLQQKLKSIGVILDPQCHYFENALTLASHNKWLDSRHKWVIPIIKNPEIDDNYTTTDVSKLIHNETDTAFLYVKGILSVTNLSVDADISIFKQIDLVNFDIYEAYNFGKIQGGNLIISRIGTWSQRDGIAILIDGYKYYQRWDFGRCAMRMSVVLKDPHKQMNQEIFVGPRPVPGMAMITQRSMVLLNIISEIHNISYKISRAEVWIGQYDRNNSDKVVASAIYFQEQDISPIIRFLPDVVDHIDLAHPPVSFIETKFYYRIPTYGPGKLENQFLTPFSTGTWGCVVGVTVLCTVVLVVAARVEDRPMFVQYAVFSVLAAFCQQCFEDNAIVRNNSAARKLTVLVTGLSFVLLYNYYTSSVVSWLLSGPPPSINSLRELLDSPLELILEDIGYSRSWVQLPGYYYFNTRNAKIEDELRQKKVYNKKNELSIYKSVEEGIEMVKSGGYAFSTEADSANRLISRKFNQLELCELGSLQAMEKAYVYTCLQKNSPYKEFFVWSLARLTERGIISCIQRRTSASVVQCEGSAPRALALGGAAPAFLLLAAGYVLAVLTLLIERAVHKFDLRELCRVT